VPESVIGTLYEPVLLANDDEGIFYQAGAFLTESDAEAVLEIWRTEGRTEPMAFNAVPVYGNVDDWKNNR
jgi:hypothetical protein